MPDQKPAIYSATRGPLNSPLALIHPPIVFETRAALVEHVNGVLDTQGYSRRARRQIDLVRLWRAIQAARGSIPAHGFTIENTLPGSRDCIRFRAHDVSKVATDCLRVKR